MSTVMMKIRKLETIEDVREWIIKDINPVLGLGFHPDTPFEEYINLTTREPSFDPNQAEELNAMLDRAFDICDAADEDIYLIGMKELGFDVDDEG
jgi:hypothetical protein